MLRKSRRRIRKSKGFIKVRRTRRHHSGGDGTVRENFDKVKEAAISKFYELKTRGTDFFNSLKTKLPNFIQEHKP